MIKIKYKGEIIDIKDIEIAWQEETSRECRGEGQPRIKIGTIEDYGQSKYSEGYDNGYDNGFKNGYDDGFENGYNQGAYAHIKMLKIFSHLQSNLY